jgi:pimeloyl-ACP methyl ester carboxylesterase
MDHNFNNYWRSAAAFVARMIRTGRRRWIIALTILFFFLLLLIGPLLVPIPPLEGTLPETDLADPDSRFIDVNGLQIHYKTQGAGQPVFILLHGFGASEFSWREVMTPLADMGTVIAYDRPAFGLTERPLPGEWSGISPYSPEAQDELVIGLLDELGIEQAILVGNSAGGTVALNTALNYPERVQGLILVDAAVYGAGGLPSWARGLLRWPQIDHFGPLLVRSIENRGEAILETSWHEPERITPEIRAGYFRPLQAANWDRALWEMVKSWQDTGLSARLGALDTPTLVITGDDDQIIPTAQSLRLAEEIPGAELALLPNCGHLPHEECPVAFLEAVTTFLE